MSATTGLVSRAELVAMEDERDAALLEVERLTQLVDNGDKMIADLRGLNDEAAKFAEELDGLAGDARLDAEGWRRAHHDVTVALARLTVAIHQVRALCAERNQQDCTYVRVTDVLAVLDSVVTP